MKLDNIDYFSAEKLQQIIENRFGQKVELKELSDNALNMFEVSIKDLIKTFERSMGFNSNSSNPYYMENKILLDFIGQEQQKRMKVSKVQGDKVELSDPLNPGVTTTIDTKKVDLHTDEKGQTSVDKKTPNQAQQQKNKIKIGQSIKMEDMDDDAKEFVDHLTSKGYKILSQGGGPNGISIEYQDREGNTHQVSFTHGSIKRGLKNDAPVNSEELKKLVMDMRNGESMSNLEKKYPHAQHKIKEIANRLVGIVEFISSAVSHRIQESPLEINPKSLLAFKLLVGPVDFEKSNRAFEIMKTGKSLPESQSSTINEVVKKLDKFIKGEKAVDIKGRNEALSYSETLKKLLENEMETSEILLASQDIVDQITDMYEKIAEIKSSAVLELVDRMSNEMGQEQAQSFQSQINPTLQALEDALSTARQGAQDAVAIVKGESPQPMAGDGDIDTSIDTDSDIEGDADIEGGDDFGASEPASGGEEPAGRAER